MAWPSAAVVNHEHGISLQSLALQDLLNHTLSIPDNYVHDHHVPLEIFSSGVMSFI